MFTSPCATFVVSVKKNIVINTVTTKTYIYIIDIIMFIYLSCICDWVFGSFVHIIVIVNFVCHEK